MRHKNFASQAIFIQRWYDIKTTSFALPFTKNALVYFVRGRKRSEPLSFDEVAGPARPYIPVEDITLKRSKDEAIRLGRAYLAECQEKPPVDLVALWQRRAFRKGWKAAMEAIKARAERDAILAEHHANS